MMNESNVFSKFEAILLELQQKRNEVTELTSKLSTANLTLQHNKKQIENLEHELENVKGQLRVSLSTINLQEETKAAVSIIPTKVQYQLMEKEVNRLVSECEKYKLLEIQLNKEKSSLQSENEQVRKDIKELQQENDDISEMIQLIQSNFTKLENEQKFVKTMVSNSNDLSIQCETMKKEIQRLQMENQTLMKEKLHLMSNTVTSEKETYINPNIDLMNTIEKLKDELGRERDEKLELQEALQKSIQLQEKIVSEFNLTVNDI